ncbi:hypothetical protein FN846DRAFT_398087 [Sphaerosporella brunnea]|uniref:Uncharacterized protein n=1 Tax=Sphaerosporella brunnea TaxID=1250544 RepID=A0A5J5EHS1_9PEZI|nr:hypothetical protein FN846DRAFT_398087 [Sphaerosporella brunnea]
MLFTWGETTGGRVLVIDVRRGCSSSSMGSSSSSRGGFPSPKPRGIAWSRAADNWYLGWWLLRWVAWLVVGGGGGDALENSRTRGSHGGGVEVERASKITKDGSLQSCVLLLWLLLAGCRWRGFDFEQEQATQVMTLVWVALFSSASPPLVGSSLSDKGSRSCSNWPGIPAKCSSSCSTLAVANAERGTVAEQRMLPKVAITCPPLPPV